MEMEKFIGRLRTSLKGERMPQIEKMDPEVLKPLAWEKLYKEVQRFLEDPYSKGTPHLLVVTGAPDSNIARRFVKSLPGEIGKQFVTVPVGEEHASLLDQYLEQIRFDEEMNQFIREKVRPPLDKGNNVMLYGAPRFSFSEKPVERYLTGTLDWPIPEVAELAIFPNSLNLEEAREFMTKMLHTKDKGQLKPLDEEQANVILANVGPDLHLIDELVRGGENAVEVAIDKRIDSLEQHRPLKKYQEAILRRLLGTAEYVSKRLKRECGVSAETKEKTRSCTNLLSAKFVGDVKIDEHGTAGYYLYTKRSGMVYVDTDIDAGGWYPAFVPNMIGKRLLEKKLI